MAEFDYVSHIQNHECDYACDIQGHIQFAIASVNKWSKEKFENFLKVTGNISPRKLKFEYKILPSFVVNFWQM